MTREELAQKPRTELLKMPEAKTLKGKTNMSKNELVEAIWQKISEFTSHNITNIHKNITEEVRQASSSPQNWGRSQVEWNPIHQNTNWPEPEIPSGYNNTQLVVMGRDPYWLFAYWEISQKEQQELAKKYGPWYEYPLIIRVYDITDIYFNGYNAHRYFDNYVNLQSSSWYIYVGESDRYYCCELGFIKNNEFIPIIRSNTVSTPRDRISHVVDEEWMVVEEDFQKLFRIAGGGQIGQSSVELMERFKKRLEYEVSSGAVSSLSSPVRLKEKERKFWLVVHTELILYGATEPNANVTVQGNPIKIRDDGTFTIRFTLPDGQQYIPVTAISPDQIDAITITPVVTKTTT